MDLRRVPTYVSSLFRRLEGDGKQVKAGQNHRSECGSDPKRILVSGFAAPNTRTFAYRGGSGQISDG